jgi:hypothetical protein
MHLVLALPPDAQQQLANGGLAEVPTEAQGLHSRLKVKVTAGGVLVTDGQGDSAHVLKVLELQENKTVVILDRVLFSGEAAVAETNKSLTHHTRCLGRAAAIMLQPRSHPMFCLLLSLYA